MKTNEKKGKGSFIYSLGMISYGIEYLVISYLTYALTNSFGISAITTGSIFLFSRIFDGISDIIAGVVIDRLNPKVGKARVYDLLHIPLWICLVLVFSVPNVGMTAKIIWVFVFYNILQSGIATFMNVAEPMRLQRSFEEEARVKVMRVTSIATMVFATIASVLMPQFIKMFAGQAHGWTIITLIYAVPLGILGTMRFFFLPELTEMQLEAKKNVKGVTIRECLQALFQNKYALLYGGVMICWALLNTIANGTMTYYFQYVFGDIGAQSYIAPASFLTVIAIAVMPKLIEKFGKVNTVRLGLLLAAICHFGKLLMPQNLVWIFIMYLGASVGITALSFMKPLLTIDCMTYGKWKTGNAVEAAYSTVNSLADKLGLGLGSFVLGLILQLGKYDGTQAVQVDSAVFTIKMCFTVIPCIIMVVALVFLAFYDLEKKLPQMQKELEEREK